jgi:hypothetical protein
MRKMRKMMIDEKFEDINGRKYRLYTVRSMGPGEGFGVLDRYLNAFVYGVRAFTREHCWDYLRRTVSR